VLEPAVVCTGINETGKPQLLDIPQALKPWMFNKVKKEITRDTYETIYRIVYYLPLVCKMGHLNYFDTKL
jgi:hypothetical protein